MDNGKPHVGCATIRVVDRTKIPYDLTVASRPGYLHARVIGERTAENALRFLQEAFLECVKAGHGKILLEMCLTGPSLPSGDVFRVISERSPDGARLRKIAYVDANMADPIRARFAETVAVNRAVNVRLFQDPAAAAQWLAAEE